MKNEMTAKEIAEVIAEVKSWIELFVIGLDLCPFAKVPFVKDRISYKVIPLLDHQSFLNNFQQELKLLTENEYATSVIILPTKSLGFRDYLDLYAQCGTLLSELEMDDEFQLASFHPDYQFADAAPDDQSNYTNRSPYPLVHILRVDEVEDAIEAFGDTSSIYKKNIELLNSLSTQELKKLTSK